MTSAVAADWLSISGDERGVSSRGERETDPELISRLARTESPSQGGCSVAKSSNCSANVHCFPASLPLLLLLLLPLLLLLLGSSSCCSRPSSCVVIVAVVSCLPLSLPVSASPLFPSPPPFITRSSRHLVASLERRPIRRVLIGTRCRRFASRPAAVR